MLPKNHRLTKREDFALTFAKGFYVTAGGDISLKILQKKDTATKIGFPVGKNFSKKAVMRGRARRIMRAATLELLPNIKNGFNIIVLLRPTAKDVTFQNVSKDLKKVFQKANLLT